MRCRADVRLGHSPRRTLSGASKPLDQLREHEWAIRLLLEGRTPRWRSACCPTAVPVLLAACAFW